MAILQALFNWAVNAASWNVFFDCKFAYCDMGAKTWIVDPEGAVVGVSEAMFMDLEESEARNDCVSEEQQHSDWPTV
jgi:hypothetical protein